MVQRGGRTTWQTASAATASRVQHTEVKSDAAAQRPRDIIATPKCTTMALAVSLRPLHDAFGLQSMVVSVRQEAGGSGSGRHRRAAGGTRRTQRSIDALCREDAATEASVPTTVLPWPIAFNSIRTEAVSSKTGTPMKSTSSPTRRPRYLAHKDFRSHRRACACRCSSCSRFVRG